VLERVLAGYHRAERHGGAGRVTTNLLDGLLSTTTERAFRRADRLPPDGEVLRILEDADDRPPRPRTGSTTATRRRTSAVLAPITYRRAPRRLAAVVSGPIRELGVTEGGARGGICTRPDRGGNGC
jgi:hypothetical protein